MRNLVRQRKKLCDNKIEFHLEPIAAKVNKVDITGLREASKKNNRKNELFEQQQKMNNQKRILFLKKQLTELEKAA